jgi:prevent-host-death family protein
VIICLVMSDDQSAGDMAGSRIVSASEFKAKCLDILDRVGRREIERVIITKRGAAVAVLVPPPAAAAQIERLHGFLRGSVVIPAEVDLTAPASDEPFAASRGEVHR